MIGIAFMETSAKDATNVQVAFERVLNEIYKIATKNAVKEIKANVSAVTRGKKLDQEEAPPAAPVKNDKVRLSSKKAKETKKGCC